ncbi:type I-U CRISPR-associated protein Csx17 [Streptomyces sp. RFCAC02]|uniref:type I-G CRISPR-associated protein Cas8g1/Csx17 n=1 Tax=Streptomyces sp. RFCAC02 TaxID=2499143 RepID=UPI001021EDA2|nr:type I-U CRISPR-associated protein Csx17 [Streptomyces sp. RFCAC02]
MAVPGLEAVSLADYLCALGLLRAVATQYDADAALAWQRGVPVLASTLDADGLACWLTEDFVPSPLVSPWNAGSGFNGNGKSKEAERALETVEHSTAARLAPLREAVAAGRAVVEEGRDRGWAGGTMWDEKHKTSLLTLCRNRMPDAVLPWMDTALALDGEDVSYNPLAGTGGNFGRQDLSASYLQQLLQLLGPPSRPGTVLPWARSLIDGTEEAPYVRGTVGQFDPGRGGGIHSSMFEKLDDKGFVNPWRTVLTCEGLLLFAGSVARRNAAAAGHTSPFVVRSTPYGYGTAAEEKAKGELWAPLWPTPARLPELEQLMGEGRAQYRGRQARNGFDFARAAGTLGVDRSLTAFRRFAIVERLGQNPLAIRAGDVPVGPRTGELSLLREAFDWVQRLRDPLPATVASLLRRTRASMFTLAAGTRETDAEIAVFVRLFGQLHEAVARSGALREKVSPFRLRERAAWRPAHAGGELRLAAALAALADRPGGPPALRAPLTRSRPEGPGRAVWTDRPLSKVDLDATTLAPALAAAHQRRLWELADQRDQAGIPPAFAYPAGPPIPPPPGLVQDFVDGHLDDQLLADLLRGLVLLGWHVTDPHGDQTAAAADARPLGHPLATLMPFYGDTLPRVRSRLRRDQPPFKPVLRPRSDWANRLRAGHLDAVLADARLRMRQAHCPPASTPRESPAGIDGTRLAAALLFPVTPEARARALTAVTVTALLHIPDNSTPAKDSDS